MSDSRVEAIRDTAARESRRADLLDALANVTDEDAAWLYRQIGRRVGGIEPDLVRALTALALEGEVRIKYYAETTGPDERLNLRVRDCHAEGDPWEITFWWHRSQRATGHSLYTALGRAIALPIREVEEGQGEEKR